MKYIFILLLITVSIFPQEEKEKYQQFRTMINSGNLSEAESKIEEELKKEPGQSTLTLYLTEIWIEKANRLYNQKKLKSAFVLYEKAYKNWNSHPIVRKRYFELKDRKLTDAVYNRDNSIRKDNIFYSESKSRENEFEKKLQKEVEELKNLNSSLEKKLMEIGTKLDNIHYKSTLGIGISIGMNLTILILLIIKLKNK